MGKTLAELVQERLLALRDDSPAIARKKLEAILELVAGRFPDLVDEVRRTGEALIGTAQEADDGWEEVALEAAEQRGLDYREAQRLGRQGGWKILAQHLVKQPAWQPRTQLDRIEGMLRRAEYERHAPRFFERDHTGRVTSVSGRRVKRDEAGQIKSIH